MEMILVKSLHNTNILHKIFVENAWYIFSVVKNVWMGGASMGTRSHSGTFYHKITFVSGPRELTATSADFVSPQTC
jgi:hypothetical protein